MGCFQSWILEMFSIFSLEKVDKKLFLIGSLLDKKFNEVLAKLSNETSSTEKTTINVNRQINPTLIEVTCYCIIEGSFTDSAVGQVKKWQWHRKGINCWGQSQNRRPNPGRGDLLYYKIMRGSFTSNSVSKDAKWQPCHRKGIINQSQSPNWPDPGPGDFF